MSRSERKIAAIIVTCQRCDTVCRRASPALGCVRVEGDGEHIALRQAIGECSERHIERDLAGVESRSRGFNVKLTACMQTEASATVRTETSRSRSRERPNRQCPPAHAVAELSDTA